MQLRVPYAKTLDCLTSQPNHISKLEDLPPLKQADGASLLEFVRHLDVANRTLSGMRPEYVSDLNQTNTLRELNKKLPLFMRVKWTECVGRIISFGAKPKFADFLKHLKDRAALVNNEFGEDLNAAPSKEWENVNRRDQRGRNPRMTHVTIWRCPRSTGKWGTEPNDACLYRLPWSAWIVEVRYV